MKEKIKDTIKFVLLLLMFVYGYKIIYWFLKTNNFIDVSDRLKANTILNIVNDYFELIVVLILFFNLLIKHGKELFKNKFIDVLKEILGTMFVGYISVQLFNIVFSLAGNTLSTLFGIGLEQANNQNLINQVFKSSPINMFITICIVGPIIEELIFRGALHEVIKNKRVFIAVSGLIFGLIHIYDGVVLLYEILIIGLIIDYIMENDKYSNKIMPSIYVIIIILISFISLYWLINGNLIKAITSLQPTELVNSFSYIGMGVGLAYIYTENNNIIKNISIHSTVNIIALIISLFI